MSTKTTFKRIALVAVAALGLGVLSVAPSSAAVSSLTLAAVQDGTASITDATNNKAASDTTTAALVSVKALQLTTDSLSVTVYEKSKPAGAVSAGIFGFYDTTTTNTLRPKLAGAFGAADSYTVGGATSITETGTTSGWVGASYYVMLETMTNGVKAGTYVFTVAAQPYVGGILTGAPVTQDVSIVVSKASAISTTVSPSLSTAYLGAGTDVATTADAVVTAVATADSTVDGTITVKLYNAKGAAVADDSVTATVTGAGVISFDGTNYGKSITYSATGGTATIRVRGDGTAGVSTIAVSTPGVTFPSKTVTFYALSPKTITAAVNNPVLKVGTNGTAVAATAVDSNGTAWTGQLYIVASAAADALIGGSATAPVPCSYSSTYKVHFCPVTTLTTGTAKFKVVDETLDLDGTYAAADSAATSNEVSVTVSNSPATSVKLAFDKASYQPFEKAYITVTVLDSKGAPRQGQAYTNVFATGGITSNIGFSANSDTLTATDFSTEVASGTGATAGAKTYVVYMPAQGTVTITATGGTGLAAAGQVAVTASAAVTNSSVDAATDAANEATDAANAATDAALAAADAADAATAAAQDASDAVAALSASVEKLVASLKAQLTSLTNLVIKIQKKVKA